MKITRRQLRKLIIETLGVHADTHTGRKSARMYDRMQSPMIDQQMLGVLSDLEINDPDLAQHSAEILGSEEDQLPQKWDIANISVDEMMTLPDSALINLFGWERVSNMKFANADEKTRNELEFKARALGKPVEALLVVDKDENFDTYKKMIDFIKQIVIPGTNTKSAVSFEIITDPKAGNALMFTIGNKKGILMGYINKGSVTI